MARAFKLPDLGEGIHEGEIQDVLVSVGEEVEEDQNILVVETDKAAVEIPSPYAGTVQEIRVAAGDRVNVGDVLLVFDGGAEEPETENAEEPAAEPRGADEARAQPEPEEPTKTPVQDEAVAGAAPQPDKDALPIPAAPSTRRLARELGVELARVKPSGPGGRVLAEDVRAHAEKGPAEKDTRAKEEPKAAPEKERAPAGEAGLAPLAAPPLPDFSRWGAVERTPLRSVRRAIAKHMALSWSQIPHVNHHDEADITELEELRQTYKNKLERGRLTMTVFVMKAAAAALKAYPRFNASLDPENEEIVLKRYYHMGVAVDTERGLIVPVIRDVDCKSIAELAAELEEVVARTQAGEASLDELQGGTFTLTNIGVLGGTNFEPIINYPEVAILGMARARWQPVVQENKEIVPRYILPLILTFDHRVVDGADAARFMRTVIDALENPGKLLLVA
jgi:pyruvate dehydrogenase E2 component (dihydrolipoamide acetyltransferase)